MNCQVVQAKLSELLYEELPAEQRELLQLHLEGCPDCRGQWSALKAAHGWLDVLSDEHPRPSIDASSIQRKYWNRKQNQTRRWRNVGLVCLAVSSVILGAVVLGIRVEIHRGHVVIGWRDGESIAAETDEPRIMPSKEGEILAEHGRRLESIEELAYLTAGEVLEADHRHEAELMRMWDTLSRMDRFMDYVLARAEQKDQGWELLALELLRQDSLAAGLDQR